MHHTSPPLLQAAIASTSRGPVQRFLRSQIRVFRQTSPRQIIKDNLLIAMGIFTAAIGLRGFLLPSEFLDGGVTGISLLVRALTGWDLSILLIVFNIPFIVLGYRQISLGFAIRTLVAIICLALCLAFLQLPVFTHDKLLIAVFGGFFLGAGIGMSIRGGCVLDGTEILALYLSRKTGFTVGDIIMAINVCIFSVSAILINVETALYAMLTYFSASRTIEFIITGLEEYTAITIVSEKSEYIRRMIVNEMGRGVTMFKGQRGFGKRGERDGDIDIVYTVITRLEITRLKNAVAKIDNQAFIVQHSIQDTKGGMIKKRAFH
ncbi:YitT family protein [Siphonobacter sp.]|uniref:YitT family protein n=1 Tax=Siphonobacter sp. TaxID=1869184 RepID=UPI003B3AFDCD